jgi:tripartite-type tricarboxylate transporter receptor subunit TctC
LAVPAQTPRDVVLRLSREIQAIMDMPDVKKRLSDVNLNAQGSTPEQAAELLAADIRRWHDVIVKAKIDKQ